MLETEIGSYAPTWIKVDPGSTSLGSSELLIKSIEMNYDMIRRS